MDRVEIALRQANRDVNRGDFAAMDRQYDEALRMCPNCALVYTERAFRAWNTGRPMEALAAYETAQAILDRHGDPVLLQFATPRSVEEMVREVGRNIQRLKAGDK